MQEIVCHIYGRVQMVMYRDFIKRGARHLGLTGYVKNRSDDSVEVLAQGAKAELKRLIERLHEGSLLSHVERVDVQWRDNPTKKFDSFDIVL
jgi:acylphosphatase